jgi:hypothetical protein
MSGNVQGIGRWKLIDNDGMYMGIDMEGRLKGCSVYGVGLLGLFLGFCDY